MMAQPDTSAALPADTARAQGARARLRLAWAWLARQLEVAPGAPWWMWLWRCVVLPATPERALLPWLLQPLHWLFAGLSFLLRWGWKGLALALAAVFWPIRLFLRAMDRLAAHVNVGKGMRLADQVLSPALEIPGLRWAVLAVGTWLLFLQFTSEIVKSACLAVTWEELK